MKLGAATVGAVARLLVLGVAIALSGCGGGGSQSDPSPVTPINTTVVVKGLAYAGAPMAGATVTVRTAAEAQTTTAAPDGSYSVSLAAAANYRIRAESSDHSLVAYSFATSTAGVVQVNVSPMTTAIVYNASKVSPPDFFLGDRPLSAEELRSAEQEVQRALGQTLLQNGMTPDGNSSFLTGSFPADHRGRDGVLDAVRVAVSSAGVVVLPAEGLPVNLRNATTAFAPTANQTKAATIWQKISSSVVPTPQDLYDAANTTINRLEVVDELHIYNSDDVRAFVFNGVAREFLKGKLVDAMKAAVLDRLQVLGAITLEEEGFLRTLDEATFGAFFLTPYINLASGRTATNGLELRILEEFNATRPGKWLLDPNRAAKDTRPVIQWLSSCPLPTRIYEGVMAWFSSSAGNSCAAPATAPSVSLTVSPSPANEGDVIRLDASGSSGNDLASLSYAWTVSVSGATGNVVLVDRTRPVAYLVASQISPGSQIDVTVSVTDSSGASTSRSSRLTWGTQPTCALPRKIINGACVVPTAPTVTLSATPNSLTSGGTVSLNWSATDADTCTSSEDWSGTRPVQGTLVLTPGIGGRVYRLACMGPGGQATAAASVQVTAAPLPPTVNLSLSQATISTASSTILQWSATDANSCVASGAWTGSQMLSGSRSVSGPVGDQVFTLVCTGPGGTRSTSATLRITEARIPSISLVSSPASFGYGTTAVLEWSTVDATSCTASGAWSGVKSINGAQSIAPWAGSYVYTLTCTGPAGSATASTTVQVSATTPAPSVSLTATPGNIVNGASAVLQWTVSDALACTASGDWSGAKSLGGSATLSPGEGTYSYVLTCSGAGGSSSATAQLTVTPSSCTPPLVLLNGSCQPVASGLARVAPTGMGDGACYGTSGSLLTSCTSPEALALSGPGNQDGMRTAPFAFARVANPTGGQFALEECISDTTTGLMWEGKLAGRTGRGGQRAFTNYGDGRAGDSSAYVAEVNATGLCGFRDWRLPSPEELNTLADLSKAVLMPTAAPFPVSPVMDPAWLPNTPEIGFIYWGMGRNLGPFGNTYWGLSLAGGYVTSRPSPSSVNPVRLVRQAVARSTGFTPVADGSAVRDERTGLIWRRCAEGMLWNGNTCTGTAQSFDQVQAFALARQTAGWRLPTIKELSSLVDRSRTTNPLMDPTAFPAAPASGYWSSTPSFPDNSLAYYLDFGAGGDQSVIFRVGLWSHQVRLVRETP